MARVLFVALLCYSLQTGPQQPPFKSGVNLVEVDVVVTDAAGQPVRGLRQEDFEILEDNKPVTVATFAAIDLPQAPAGEKLPEPDRSGTSLASNDLPADGRVVLIILDDYHVRFDAGYADRTRRAAKRLVERLGESDLAAVMATSGRSSMQAEFTGDKARLVEAIDRFFPQSEDTPSSLAVQSALGGLASGPIAKSGYVKEIKARWAMEAMSNAATALSQIRGRRKTVLLVSEGFPVDMMRAMTSGSVASNYVALRDFVLTAQRSNVAVYPVDPCGLSSECSRDTQDNLRSIAESTGGFAIVNSNFPEPAIDRIVAEAGTYYLLGYVSPAAINDGRRHRITVRTRVRDVEVRARSGHLSPRRNTKAPPTPPLLEKLVAGPIQTRGLTMRVVAVPVPIGTAPGASIVVGIEVPAADAADASNIEFSAVAIDERGTVRMQQRVSGTLTDSDRPTAGWARVRMELRVQPGRHFIRVAAVGKTNTHGSVYTEVDVPRFDTRVALGGLSLVAATDVNATSGSPDREFVPAASRVVIRGLPSAAAIGVRVAQKSAGTLVVKATLNSPNGTAVELDADTRDTDRPNRLYRIAIPPDLAPGTYRLVLSGTVDRATSRKELTFQVIQSARGGTSLD